MLNARGIKTKRGCEWSQNAVCRILENELYTGKIVNGKEEVSDFLTGKRTLKNEDEWYVADRPDLRIISDEDFAEAGRLKADRGKKFRVDKERHSNQHLFSTLIKCKIAVGRSEDACVLIKTPMSGGSARGITGVRTVAPMPYRLMKMN